MNAVLPNVVAPLKVSSPPVKLETGNPYLKGRIGTLDLLVLTRSNQLILILKLYIFFLISKITYLNVI